MKQSAGLLLYRGQAPRIEVMLVHPGGPFWAKKDAGAWSIPKGEAADGEDPLAAAKREFSEEIGQPVPAGELLDLGFAKVSSSKVAYVWACAADMDVKKIKSNAMQLEWPPRSGQQKDFPEVDKAGWFSLSVARQKLVKGQVVFVERLAQELGVDIHEVPVEPPETTLTQPVSDSVSSSGKQIPLF